LGVDHLDRLQPLLAGAYEHICNTGYL